MTSDDFKDLLDYDMDYILKDKQQPYILREMYKTAGCPLARVMRRELKQRGIHHLKVVYSQEPAAAPATDAPVLPTDGKRTPPASLPFVPASAGLLLASAVIYDLISAP